MKRDLLAAALVAALGVAAFATSLGNGFAYDDQRIVAGNVMVQQPSGVFRLWFSDYWGPGQVGPALYRPVTVFTYWLNRHLLGAEPWHFHMVNVLLHGAVTALLFVVARGLGLGLIAALVAAGLFATHAVHTEAVANVVGRAEMLAACGVLGAFALHLRDYALAGWPRRRGLLIATLCLAAGVASKEVAAAGIVILPLWDIVSGRLRPAEGEDWFGAIQRKTLETYALPAAAVAGVLLVRTLVLSGRQGVEMPPEVLEGILSVDNPLAAATLLQREATAFAVLGEVLSLLVWPAPLSPDYSRDAIPLVEDLSLSALWPPLILVASGVLAWRTRARHPAAAGAFLLFLVPWFVVSNLVVTTGTILAERTLYLPSAGFCLALAAATEALLARPPGPARPPGAARVAGFALAGLAALAAAAHGVWAARQSRNWKDEGALWKHAVEAQPRSSRALSFRGKQVLERDSDPKAARPLLETAVDLAPGLVITYEHLGECYRQLGMLPELESLARRARERFSSPTDTLVTVPFLEGLAAEMAGRKADAIERYRRAVIGRPILESAAQRLAGLLTATGDLEGARKFLEEYRRASPGNAQALLHMGLTALKGGDRAGAEASFRAALAADPGLALASEQIGLLRANEGNFRESAEWFEKARAAVPGYPQAWWNLASSLERLGETDRLLRLLAEAEKRFPEAPDPDVRRGVFALRTDDVDGAIRRFEAALVKDPKSADAHVNLVFVYTQKRPDPARAAAHARAALEAKPDHEQAAALRGLAGSR
ncbi:MAG: tetratricopeptide repeat protein [Planctomycetales bacterium]|nr:tetratricopeptide repeat protein [Planctomycetales bacterium]